MSYPLDGRLHWKFEVNRQPFLRYERPKFHCFFFFLFFFSYKHKNCCNLEMCASIGLKFGRCVGQPKANISTKFCEDSTKSLVVINDHSHKQRSMCWLAYRVNRWLDRPENGIQGAFWWLKMNGVRGNRDMRLDPTLVKNLICVIDFCVIEFQPLSDEPSGGISWKLLWLSTRLSIVA